VLTSDVICYPKSDEAFRRFVQELVSDLSAADDDEMLFKRLHSVYPRAVLRRREPLSGFGHDEAWYAYRDGRPTSELGEHWWDDPSVAQTVILDDGIVTEANEEACRLHGLPPGEVIGRRWDEFATLEAAAEAAALWGRMIQGEWPASDEPIQSTFSLVRADGLIQPVEYRTVRQADGTFRTWLRPLGAPEPITKTEAVGS
jgi:PAS domain S-box-containing protein